MKKCTEGTVTRSATDCTGSTVTGLTYDALNRLTQAVKGSATESYASDDQGRRIAKTVGSVTTNFLYNGPDIGAYRQGRTPLRCAGVCSDRSTRQS